MGMLLEMAKAGSLQNVSPEVIEKLMALDAKGARMLMDGKWEESKHPRGKGGKFAKKGSGGVSSSESKGESKSGSKSEVKSGSKSESAVSTSTGTSPASAAIRNFMKRNPGAKAWGNQGSGSLSNLKFEMAKPSDPKAKAKRELEAALNKRGDELRKEFKIPKLSEETKAWLKTPEGKKALQGVGNKLRKSTEINAGPYKAPAKLSPVHEKASNYKRDTKAQDAFAKVATNKEGMKKMLDDMPVGTVLRYNERGYSLYTKQADGSWTYQNAFSSSAQPTTTDKMFEDAQVWKDPKTGVKDPSKAFQGVAVPKKGEAGRNAEWDARRAVANLEPNPGDAYDGKRVDVAEARKNGAARMAGRLPFPKEKGNASAGYTKESVDANGNYHVGAAVGKLKNGSGVTKIDHNDILQANPDGRTYNTLAEHCMEDKNGNLVLTPEREKLHQAIMEETFAKAEPVPEGQKKIFTMLGGGSAAGKGTIQKAMPELFNQNSPVIDADEMKKRIPEYVDTAFSPDHESAASMAHEESSALVKRAMQTAFANGYNCTLDGTGDGKLESMKKKIEQAQKNGYSVEGVYVTCPTDLAVERNEGRSKTDEYNRLVPPSEVRKIHAAVSRIFPEVAPLMDHVVLYDTNRKDSDGKPLKLAECWKGQEIQVVPECKKYYQEFLDKGKEA